MRGAQEHPWMSRMAPRSGEEGMGELKGEQRDSHPNFKQVGQELVLLLRYALYRGALFSSHVCFLFSHVRPISRACGHGHRRAFPVTSLLFLQKDRGAH